MQINQNADSHYSRLKQRGSIHIYKKEELFTCVSKYNLTLVIYNQEQFTMNAHMVKFGERKSTGKKIYKGRKKIQLWCQRNVYLLKTCTAWAHIDNLTNKRTKQWQHADCKSEYCLLCWTDKDGLINLCHSPCCNRIGTGCF